MDIKRYARFDRPGHAVTGDRTRNSRGAGYTYAHAVVDDHTRLAYVELHDDQTAPTVTAFTIRALAWFASHRVRVKRLMTDNAWAYTKNKKLAKLLADRHIRHITIRPYRPRTNGKVERFHQTMAREWGYGHVYLTDRHRAKALPYWLRYYNEQRPHSALGGQSPISRVRNLPGHDTYSAFFAGGCYPDTLRSHAACGAPRVATGCLRVDDLDEVCRLGGHRRATGRGRSAPRGHPASCLRRCPQPRR